MLLRSSPDPLQSPAYRTGGLVLFAAIAVILTALGFQYIGGYAPCPLCLQQRYAYYAGIPLVFLALVLALGVVNWRELRGQFGRLPA